MKKPNIILINCDDLGYGDLACYGSPVNHSPYLDSLAKRGMKFTSCYTASPVCSPSRAALMTGCLPPRVGITRVLFPGQSLGLSKNEYTIADLLHDNGYKTMIVGKWHIGDQEEFLPCQHGFDRYYGLPYSNDMGRMVQWPDRPPLPLMSDNEVVEEQPDQKGLTERYTERCLEFIRQNKDNNFFLYFAQMHVHLPLYAADRFVEESENGDFGACVGELDWACGRIEYELKKLGIYDDTIIIFTSDNGSRGDHGASNKPLRGGKFTTWEGGLRVPMIAFWNNHIPAGTVNENIFCHVDFLETIASLIGAKLPETKTDSINQLETFKDPSKASRDFMVYYGGDDLNAIRKGDWKLHLRANGEETTLLYNLKDDIGEQHNLKDQYPEKVAELKALIDEWRLDLGDKRLGIKGTGNREAGFVENPKPLTNVDENHPYIVALYDKNDCG